MNTATDVALSHHLNQNQHNVSFQSHAQPQPVYNDLIKPQQGYDSFGHQGPGYSDPVKTSQLAQERGLNIDAAEPAAIRSSFAVGVSICLHTRHLSGTHACVHSCMSVCVRECMRVSVSQTLEI